MSDPDVTIPPMDYTSIMADVDDVLGYTEHDVAATPDFCIVAANSPTTDELGL